MRIEYTKVRWMNFFATGNEFIEVDLLAAPATLLVGLNGSGKSTFIDVMTYVLYNKPFRKDVRLPQLVNSITRKGTLGEVEFKRAGRHYLVRRGMKPAVFEVYENGKLVDQDASVRDYQAWLEKDVIGYDYRTFTQVDVLGSDDYTPFMKLPAGVRRQFVEDLLDQNVFSVMNSILRDRLVLHKKALNEATHKLDVTSAKLEVHSEHAKRASEDNATKIECLKIQLKQVTESYEADRARRDQLNESINAAQSRLADREPLRIEYDKANSAAQYAQHEIDRLTREARDLDIAVCPTCKQGITHEYRASGKEMLDHQLAIVNDNHGRHAALAAELHEKKRVLDDLYAQMTNMAFEVRTMKSSIIRSASLAQEYVADIKKLKEIKPPAVDLIHDLEEEVSALEEERHALLRKGVILEAAGQLLKDGGIKARIIKQYVPVMNQLINKYLAAMDFMIDFNFDENFNETIRSRYRDDFTYGLFSSGQKQRIDLALLFTWRDIARARNSAGSNVLIFDEILDSSLDLAGMDDLMKIIASLGDEEKIFVISHRGDAMVDKFKRVLKFKLNRNFTHMEEAA